MTEYVKPDDQDDAEKAGTRVRHFTCLACNGTGRVEMSPRMILGLNIRTRRIALGMKQEDLAQRVTIGRAQIANVESGRSGLRIDGLWEFANALGCSIADLFAEPTAE